MDDPSISRKNKKSKEEIEKIMGSLVKDIKAISLAIHRHEEYDIAQFTSTQNKLKKSDENRMKNQAQ